ncbi:hypothetical protein ABIA25_000287 [Sinorhizobium fredii]|uniref:hypothetical protein n=1 Tax=Rhizobium fredii TaxID=380 RepID=UPI003517DF74
MDWWKANVRRVFFSVGPMKRLDYLIGNLSLAIPLLLISVIGRSLFPDIGTALLIPAILIAVPYHFVFKLRRIVDIGAKTKSGAFGYLILFAAIVVGLGYLHPVLEGIAALVFVAGLFLAPTGSLYRKTSSLY